MKDPFFLQPSPWLAKAVQPWADFLSLPTLPLHAHEVVFGLVLYSVIYFPLSPILSTALFPNHYPQLPRGRKLNWDAHVVSLVQSCLINALALWVMAVDQERAVMDLEQRVWGYSGGTGMVQGLAAGYFLWDLVVTSRNIDVFGLGTLAHAVSALLVYSFGFRPFVNYYGTNFILWELSTPFLNIHWFLDKLNMTGSSLQLYNGLLLIGSFFSCRLVYGTYQSFCALRDMWALVGLNPSPETIEHLGDTMRFATETSTVPLWLAVLYLLSNFVLNGLNVYWFVKMIDAVAKRFRPAKEQPIALNEKPSSGVSTATRDLAMQARKRASSAVEEIPISSPGL